MPSNEEAARLLRSIADVLDLQGERFKPEAYRRAARSVEALGEELELLAAQGRLGEIPGVGAAIEEKLREYLRDGRIGYLDRISAEVPSGLAKLLSVPGLGPKTVRRFWTELGILGPAELLAAIDAGRLEGVKGFGPLKIRQIRTALEGPAPSGRIPLRAARTIAESLVRGLRAGAPVDRIEVAGSYRRARETVGDLDLLVTSSAPEAAFDAFERLPEVAEVRLRGGTKETVVLRSGLQVDLRIVEPAAYGAALQYFTGSKEHNVRLRTRARDRGLKVNEYGVYRGEERVAGATEEEVYRSLGLAWVPPEIREDRGEIDAAEAGTLPALVTPGDLRGDLHLHVGADAPGETARRIRAAARAAGHRYVGVVLGAGVPSASWSAWSRAAGSRAEGPRILLGIEGTAEELAATADRVADYRLLRAVSAGGPPTDGPPDGVLAVVHRGFAIGDRSDADPTIARPWVRWAGEHGVALEVRPEGASAGADSVVARAALEAGGSLLVSGASEGAPDLDGLAVALGFARRAGATAEQVRNASASPL